MADIPFKPHSVILFQGDSITDAGRSWMSVGPNLPESLGQGYPRLIADQLLSSYPNQYLQFYNRGISGNRIQDLVSRWEVDTLRLLPDLVSILIGINDTWNHLFMGLGTDPENFQEIYDHILKSTREQLPEVTFILCEPFLLITGEVTEEWSRDLVLRQSGVKQMAEKYDAIFIPFQSALDQATREYPPHLLLHDGVHPTPLGHQVLADFWIKTLLNS
jgi:lysophospholipase L1-like esterase